MSSSKKEDYVLELEGIDRQISKLNVEVYPESDYENHFIPRVEVEDGSDGGWSFNGDPEKFAVRDSKKDVARFKNLEKGPPAWVESEKKASRHWLSLVHEVGADSRVFGLGEKTGYIEKSGRDYKMWNRDPNGFYTHNEDPLYSSVPFYIVQREGEERGFVGIYLHQAEESYFRVKNGDLLDGVGISVAAPKATFYLIAAGEIKEVVKSFTKLTGKPLLPPRWALGYHHSKYGVPRNQEEALNLAEEFRERRLPCDTIYFDIQHMDENKDFTWDRDRFPDPEGLIDKLHDMNYRVVNIVDPGIKEEKGYEVYESGRENDVFVKDEDGDDFSGSVWPGFCSFPDFIREGVRDWWADQNEKLLAQGVDGIWNDMNEPAVFFGKKQLREVADSVDEEVEDGGHLDYEFKFDLRNLSDAASEDMVHHNETGEEVDHGKVHNLYGYYEALATRKAFENKRPDQRPFILTRAGFAGMQKYVAKWTGDNSSTWEHMKMSIYMALNLGLSGVPFVGPDIGGFSGDVESELLTRWIQLGSVFPFYRNHSGLGTVSQEPWSFGDENEEINRKYMSLRYQLLPYLYTEFYRTHETGLPILRPLFMEFSDDEETYSVADQFMVGESILVAPVVERNSDKRLLYLPHGNNGEELDWKSWWSGEFLTSGYHLVKAPLDVMPMYIRPGHGVPFTETVQYTGEIPELLKLAVNKGQDGGVEVEIPVYHDDGETKDWQDGKFFYGSFLVDEVDGDVELDLKIEKDAIEPFWEEVQVR